MLLDEYMTLWGEPDDCMCRIWGRYMCHQNVTEPQATEYHKKYTL